MKLPFESSHVCVTTVLALPISYEPIVSFLFCDVWVLASRGDHRDHSQFQRVGGYDPVLDRFSAANWVALLRSISSSLPDMPLADRVLWKTICAFASNSFLPLLRNRPESACLINVRNWAI
ncbi:hypothetical protein [Sphingomonas sp. TREG-RG-20F-R18-01]|uniref:hypothetical protein n=1 Tax=Sphingomonas sp. TREG-RG-20F-R18-01 TaxID=2914982 RepID=UPI001F5A46FB|nr:hypothetical protein [Sphingomonas sp. TREG-RG-20F-R18-01]